MTLPLSMPRARRSSARIVAIIVPCATSLAFLAGFLCLAGCATVPDNPSSATKDEDIRADRTPPSAELHEEGGNGGGPSSLDRAAPEEPEKAPPLEDRGKRLSPLEETWGIRILALRLSAGGYMLDFRYRVLDPEKAGPLFDRKTKPYLIDQASGARMIVPSPPKVGPLRTSDKPMRDRNYFVLFANPGRYIKKGNQVTVVIGDFRTENLTVE